jgi:hypothetical protein
MILRLLLLLATLPMSLPLTARIAETDADRDARFAALALACVQREYPNQIRHVMTSDADVAPPRELTPAFYGCYDWHSAVHGHWLLVRLTRLSPDADYAPAARAALAANLTEDALQREADYMAHPERAGFQRPYGLAWLLQLVAELEQWDDDQARNWREHLRPLEAVALDRMNDWLPKLHYPIRGGEHFQTAFAFGLIWDYAQTVGNGELERLLNSAAQRFYRNDRDCPLSYEPSGHDFLSPCLAEADFMRRALPETAYATWLHAFLPSIGTTGWLPVATVTDRSDGKLAHIDGLNLSRAWMLEGMASGLSSSRDAFSGPEMHTGHEPARAVSRGDAEDAEEEQDRSAWCEQQS